jgi:hypothetical protein
MEDILYTIMLDLSFKDVTSYIVTNKLATSVDTNNFWRNKFNKDFQDVQINNISNWKKEYYNMVQSINSATKLVNVLELSKFGCDIHVFFVSKNINIKNIYWLPPNISNIIQIKNIKYDSFIGSLNYVGPVLFFNVINSIQFVYNLKFAYMLECAKTIYIEQSEFNRANFIDMITKFLYHYPDGKISNCNDDMMLYKDLVNKVILTNHETYIMNIYKTLNNN